VVKIVKADGLIKADTFSSDPYVHITLPYNKVYQSKHIKSTLNPKFNYEVQVEIPDTLDENQIKKLDKIHISLFDYDWNSADDFLGEIYDSE